MVSVWLGRSHATDREGRNGSGNTQIGKGSSLPGYEVVIDHISKQIVVGYKRRVISENGR